MGTKQRRATCWVLLRCRVSWWLACHYLLLGSWHLFQFKSRLFLFSGIVCSGLPVWISIFNDLGSKSKGIAYLTLPASHPWKIAVRLVLWTDSVSAHFIPWSIIPLMQPPFKISNNERYQHWLYWKIKLLQPRNSTNAPHCKRLSLWGWDEYNADGRGMRNSPSWTELLLVCVDGISCSAGLLSLWALFIWCLQFYQDNRIGMAP